MKAYVDDDGDNLLECPIMGRPLWLCFVCLICLCPGTSSSRARQRTPSSSTDGGMAFEAQTRKRALQQPPEANVFMNAAAAAVGQILVKDDAKDRQLERSLAKPPHASVDSISQVPRLVALTPPPPVSHAANSE